MCTTIFSSKQVAAVSLSPRDHNDAFPPRRISMTTVRTLCCHSMKCIFNHRGQAALVQAWCMTQLPALLISAVGTVTQDDQQLPHLLNSLTSANSHESVNVSYCPASSDLSHRQVAFPSTNIQSLITVYWKKPVQHVRSCSHTSNFRQCPAECFY